MYVHACVYIHVHKGSTHPTMNIIISCGLGHALPAPKTLNSLSRRQLRPAILRAGGCMQVCVYACRAGVCMQVCACMCVGLECACMYACMSAWGMYAGMCVYACVYVGLEYVCKCACMRACMYVSVYVYDFHPPGFEFMIRKAYTHI